MYQYIIRRILQSIPTLLGITVFVFLIINAAPGNPMSHLVDPNMTGEDRANRLEALGYYDPLPVRYATWITEAVQGNLGYSTRYSRPVTQLISTRIVPTFLLTFSSMFISVLIAVPIGVFSSTRQYSKMDYFLTVLAMAGISIPVFFLAILGLRLFAFDLGWVPLGGMVTAGRVHTGFFDYALDVLHHLIMPLAVLSAANIATYMRYTRSSMLEVVRQDYIRTARAKGLSEKVVIYKHALRNALIPVVTVFGLSLPFLFSGAVITETVFTWPGMGILNVEAVGTRDYPLLMGINLFLAILVLLGNLLADIMYAVVDPRIRYN
ncbi:MAG: ABC transporter permease [Firmicutes bacterium]|nr:ABC transporter permease [Bacillota bacterium]